LGEISLGEMGLGEMGQNRHNSAGPFSRSLLSRRLSRRPVVF